MSQSQVRAIVAAIVIFGHLIVFSIGFFVLGILTFSLNADTAQVLLMASPVMAATAVAALRYVLKNETGGPAGRRVTNGFAVVVITFPTALIAMILVLFLLAYRQTDNFSMDQLKIGLGCIETFFGAFIGMISDRLFGKADPA